MITIYTDGCFKKQSGWGGYACLVIHEDGRISLRGDYDVDMGSNNRAEMRAALLGLGETKRGDEVTLISDSQYLIEGMTHMQEWRDRGWRIKSGTPAKNPALWKLMMEFKESRKLFPIWVKGHDDTTYNILCDRVADFCCKFQQRININFPSASKLFEAHESYLRYTPPTV